MHLSARLVLPLALSLAACSDSAGSGGSGGGGGSPLEGGAPGSGGLSPESCATDPLETGLVAEQTGVSADIADCSILKWAAQYGEPDPMIIKAMIYGESRFDYAATGCPNLPCGVPDGWTEAEAGCYGLMQVVPACGPIADGVGLLPSGHPNLTLDTGSPEFAGSIYNPDINIHIGVAGFAGNRAEVEGLFPGCTEDQYTLMALGNLASHGSTTSCTEINRDYIDYILPAYYEYCAAAGYAPRSY
ncbi:MAG: hypothetical protein IPM79_13510 [Polyangiaceae bacterium]|jgi:hypothetical protein|nr:hypothetical protein [Polyangiaceae bacterium]MBK8938615.1 hypothetical protein [Polyangiaceae bacterium]